MRPVYSASGGGILLCLAYTLDGENSC
jgi:hypothetical protein